MKRNFVLVVEWFESSGKLTLVKANNLCDCAPLRKKYMQWNLTERFHNHWSRLCGQNLYIHQPIWVFVEFEILKFEPLHASNK